MLRSNQNESIGIMFQDRTLSLQRTQIASEASPKPFTQHAQTHVPALTLPSNQPNLRAPLESSSHASHLGPVGQQFRGILLEGRIRKGAFLPPRPSVFDAANAPQCKNGDYETCDSCVDSDFGTAGETSPSLSGGYRGRGGQSFSDG